MCLESSRKGPVNPEKFLKASRPPSFRVDQQQDCHEFLTFLFQKLEFEHRVVMDKGQEVELGPSLVQSVYGGAKLVTYQCLVCSTMSQVETKFTMLDLPLSTTAEEPRCSIFVEDLIKDYLKPETLNGKNQYQCDTCNVLSDAVKTTRMKIYPKNLIITLLRFKFDISSSRNKKLMTRVQVPTTLYWPGSGEGLKYELYCVIVHSGLSSEEGHYFTLVRDRQTEVWTKVSDQVVKTVPGWWVKELHSMRDTTPYMLFYQKEELALKI